MILDEKPFDAILADDVLSLIPDVAEGRRIDYKASLPDTGEKGVRSFLNDVCALANSAGGCLVYGIAERADSESGAGTGIPESISGVGDVNDDDLIRAYQQRITQCIEPVIIGHRIRFIDGFEGGHSVMIVFVPKSLFAPHRVNYQGKKEFYVRHDRSNLP
ncbi:MAG: ATP-binding protein, partial [Actinomycetota bacterium]|nr:ATP-binding protein [Actinomycetota bacterium]